MRISRFLFVSAFAFAVGSAQMKPRMIIDLRSELAARNAPRAVEFSGIAMHGDALYVLIKGATGPDDMTVDRVLKIDITSGIRRRTDLPPALETTLLGVSKCGVFFTQELVRHSHQLTIFDGDLEAAPRIMRDNSGLQDGCAIGCTFFVLQDSTSVQRFNLQSQVISRAFHIPATNQLLCATDWILASRLPDSAFRITQPESDQPQVEPLDLGPVSLIAATSTDVYTAPLTYNAASGLPLTRRNLRGSGVDEQFVDLSVGPDNVAQPARMRLGGMAAEGQAVALLDPRGWVALINYPAK